MPLPLSSITGPIYWAHNCVSGSDPCTLWVTSLNPPTAQSHDVASIIPWPYGWGINSFTSGLYILLPHDDLGAGVGSRAGFWFKVRFYKPTVTGSNPNSAISWLDGLEETQEKYCRQVLEDLRSRRKGQWVTWGKVTSIQDWLHAVLGGQAWA